MSQELKPCPFCGNPAFTDCYPFDRPTMWAVECTKCNASIGKVYDNDAMPDFDYAEEDAAVNAWNTRTTDALQASHEALLAALTTVLDQLPSDIIIEELRADAGLGYRRFSASFSDKETVELRAVLANAAKLAPTKEDALEAGEVDGQ